MAETPSLDLHERFVPRHIGPDEAEIAAMLQTLGLASLDERLTPKNRSGHRLLDQLVEGRQAERLQHRRDLGVVGADVARSEPLVQVQGRRGLGHL